MPFMAAAFVAAITGAFFTCNAPPFALATGAGLLASSELAGTCAGFIVLADIAGAPTDAGRFNAASTNFASALAAFFACALAAASTSLF